MTPSSGTHRVVTLAGHVDHGKSTLLRALTGMEPDRLPEERLRGRTIELGFLWAELDPRGDRVAFVDVPGHARLIGTMIAGSGVSPAALLAVAADDGPSVQTREHLEILDLLGVPGIAIALTKVDRVDPSRVGEMEERIRAITAGTTFEDAPVIPVAALEGRGIDGVREALVSGLGRLPRPDADRHARLWIDRVFTIDGSGTVVTGTLADGPLRRGDEVGLQPGDVRARVRRLQQLGVDVELAMPGTRVAVNLSAVEVAEVRRGDVLVAGPRRPATSVLDAWVRLLPGRRLEGSNVLRLHCGTAVRDCRVRPIVHASSAEQDVEVAVRIIADAPLAVLVGDRILLRDPGRRSTVGGGVVVDPLPPSRLTAEGRGPRAVAIGVAGATLASSRGLGVAQSTWLRIPPGIRRADELAAWTGGAPTAGVPLGDWVMDAETHDATSRRLVDSAGEHTTVPAALAALARRGFPQAAAGILLRSLHERGAFVIDGDSLLPADSGEQLRDERARRRRELIARFTEAGLDPPDLTTVASDLGVEHLERQSILRSGELVRCGDVTLAARTVDAAVETLLRLQSVSGPFTASEARIALGATRRVIIPLLEHLALTSRARFDGTRHHILGQ